jgi:8-amino-7-oxononanoate synthase
MAARDPLAWIDNELDRLERAGLRRHLAVRHGPQSVRIDLNGRALINFGCNDYLGLASDERLIEAARSATERQGWGSGASPLVSGRSEFHAELERQLAAFEGTEAALVFPSGYAANAGTIPALVDEGDAIFGDAMNHASLIDGCRLSKAKRFIYPHADCDALEAMLRSAAKFRRRLIVTDTLFSMGGDIAPLDRLAKLAEEYDAMLMVDEAHATGVFGQHGRGIAELAFSRDAPAERDEVGPHIRVGTLSKALGASGGFVCGRQSLIDWLANVARTYFFSTAQPAATCAAALAALGIIRHEPHRRKELLERAAKLRLRLSEQGRNVFPPLPSGEGRGEGFPEEVMISQIIPLIIGDPNQTMRIAEQLRDAGYFSPGIRPPSVPAGQSLLRLSLCYHHTAEMIDGLVEQLALLKPTD